MKTFNIKPLNVHEWLAAGAKVADLCLENNDMRTVLTANVLGSRRFPVGMVVEYKRGATGTVFTQAFDTNGNMISEKSDMKLSVRVPKTDLEVANEKLAEAEKKIASLKSAAANAMYYAETVKLISQRTEAKYGTGAGMAKVQEYCQRVITESAKALA